MGVLIGEEILTKFESYIDDSLDQDFELQMANDVKNDIEEELDLEICKALDTSNSAVVGQTYTTAIALPEDCYSISNYIFIGTRQLFSAPYERKEQYKDLSGYFYVDWRARTLHLCGQNPTAGVITIPYRIFTDDITLETAPAWPVPNHHGAIPLRMAKEFFAIDGGDKGRTWDDRFELMYQAKLKRIIDWDAKLKLAAINNSSAGEYDPEEEV